jgi:hypothetical protein
MLQKCKDVVDNGRFLYGKGAYFCYYFQKNITREIVQPRKEMMQKIFLFSETL